MAGSRLVSDPIFTALTRPQMVGGVTYGYAVFNLIVTLELFLITRSFAVFAVALVLHLIGYLGCLREPRFFDLWMTRLQQCPRVKNFWFWGANSYRP
jgi:type IV secretion system protein VirB3